MPAAASVLLLVLVLVMMMRECGGGGGGTVLVAVATVLVAVVLHVGRVIHRIRRAVFIVIRVTLAMHVSIYGTKCPHGSVSSVAYIWVFV